MYLSIQVYVIGFFTGMLITILVNELRLSLIKIKESKLKGRKSVNCATFRDDRFKKAV